MEAEQLNIIANRLVDLVERNNALRGYLWLWDKVATLRRSERVDGRPEHLE